MFEVVWAEINGNYITVNVLVYVLWFIGVGWIFSTVGAFGVIMAGIGHISIFGIGDWASKLNGTEINISGYKDAGKYLTDTIRFGNSVQGWFNALASAINWQMQKRLVWSAGVSLGVGGIVGAQVGVWGTGGQLAPPVYIGIFGISTYLIAGYMLYQLTPRAKKNKKTGKEAAKRFQKTVKELKEQGRLHELEGIKNLKVSPSTTTFEFYGEIFRINNFYLILTGFFIGFFSAIAGIGGGFLYVIYLTSLGLPFYIIPGASALAVLLTQTSVVIGWLMKGVIYPVTLLIAGWIGLSIGSYIGPRTQKYISQDYIFVIFVIFAIYVGTGYIARSFFEIRLPGI
ncbi:MAG: sulfite exporter TauE/SafE family protein [Archaeoglobaceae archaeon]|nr:sulfite exporter TauE/SafE family protein [Archaeoglobaceae archaeon]